MCLLPYNVKAFHFYILPTLNYIHVARKKQKDSFSILWNSYKNNYECNAASNMWMLYLTQSLNLLVLPFFHKTSMAGVTIFIQSGILLVVPFSHNTSCHISRNVDFCLFCHFSIGPVWMIWAYLTQSKIMLVLPFFSCTELVQVILPYMSQSGILLVLPFQHRNSMNDFVVLDQVRNFANFAIFS